MNLSMRVTLAGLIRALRAVGHDLAERIERGEPVNAAPSRRPPRRRPAREQADVRRR